MSGPPVLTFTLTVVSTMWRSRPIVTTALGAPLTTALVMIPASAAASTAVAQTRNFVTRAFSFRRPDNLGGSCSASS